MDGPPITSLQNERVKLVRSLELRKARREAGLFTAHGLAMLEMARAAGVAPRMLVTGPEAIGSAAEAIVRWATAAGAERLPVSEAVLAKIAGRDNPQPLIGVFALPGTATPDPRRVPADAIWIALEAVRDPGNLGTILRTAHAAGASGVLLAGACCDAYAPDCVQATMGSIFAVPTLRMSVEAFLAWRSGWPGEVIGTHLAGETDYRDPLPAGPTLLLMGSEGPGLSEAMASACTRLVRIPMASGVESLNLAVATALMLYRLRYGAG